MLVRFAPAGTKLCLKKTYKTVRSTGRLTKTSEKTGAYHAEVVEAVGNGNIFPRDVGFLSVLVIGESIFGWGERISSRLRCRFAMSMSKKMAFSETTIYRKRYEISFLLTTQIVKEIYFSHL